MQSRNSIKEPSQPGLATLGLWRTRDEPRVPAEPPQPSPPPLRLLALLSQATTYNPCATRPQTPCVTPARAAHTPSSGTWSLRASAVTPAAALVSWPRVRGSPGHPPLATVHSSPFAWELAGIIPDLCFHAPGHRYSSLLFLSGTVILCLTESSLIALWGRQAKGSSGKMVPGFRVEDIMLGKASCSFMLRWRLCVQQSLGPVLRAVQRSAGDQSCLGVVGLGGKTEWAWQWVGLVEAGVTLGCLLAPLDQLETQACTAKQNRICTCKPGWYCTLGRQEGCRLCVPLRKCGPGFGVAKPGTGPGPEVLGDPLGPLLPWSVVSGGQVPGTHLSSHPDSFFPPALPVRHLLCARPWGSRDGSN